MLKDFHDPLLNLLCWIMSVREPDESDKHLLVFSHPLPQQLLMQTVCLTNLPFHSVSVDSMLKAFLGNTDQDLCRSVVAISPNGFVNSSEGEGRGRLATAMFKERLHQQIACHALPFPESRSRRHRANLVSLPDNAEELPSSKDISPTEPRCQDEVLRPWRPWPLSDQRWRWQSFPA